MAANSSRPGARRRVLRASVLLLPLLVVGLGALAALEARDRLPEILGWAAREILPGLDLRVSSARLESRSRFVVDDIVLSFADAPEPFFSADRVAIEFDWTQLLQRRLRSVRVDRPRGHWTPNSAGALALAPG